MYTYTHIHVLDLHDCICLCTFVTCRGLAGGSATGVCAWEALGSTGLGTRLLCGLIKFVSTKRIWVAHMMCASCVYVHLHSLGFQVQVPSMHVNWYTTFVYSIIFMFSSVCTTGSVDVIFHAQDDSWSVCVDTHGSACLYSRYMDASCNSIWSTEEVFLRWITHNPEMPDMT